MSGKSAALI